MPIVTICSSLLVSTPSTPLHLSISIKSPLVSNEWPDGRNGRADGGLSGLESKQYLSLAPKTRKHWLTDWMNDQWSLVCFVCLFFWMNRARELFLAWCQEAKYELGCQNETRLATLTNNYQIKASSRPDPSDRPLARQEEAGCGQVNKQFLNFRSRGDVRGASEYLNLDQSKAADAAAFLAEILETRDGS